AIRMAGVGRVVTPEMRVRLDAKEDSIQKRYAYERASVSDIVKHIDYIVRLVGIDHVGIGSDFDGGGGVNGLEDVSEIEALTLELVRKGYSEQDIAKIWGGNLLRVLGQAKVTQ
ncbi:MAG: membrane dipeptidase, partial [Sphingobacteriales bacterium]